MNVQYRVGSDSIDYAGLVVVYKEAGLGERPVDMLTEAFRNSYKVVTAWEDQKLIGAGRVISDGVIYASIYDLAVLPSYQGHGIGKEIMGSLLKGNEKLFMYLTSTFGHEGFYEKIGFKKHKTAYAKYPFESKYLE